MKYLINTEAEVSIIPQHHEFCQSTNGKSTNLSLTSANGTNIRTYGRMYKIIQIGGIIKQGQTFICADVNEAIIGTDFLQNHNAQINFNDHSIQTNCECHHGLPDQHPKKKARDCLPTAEPPARLLRP